MFPVASFIFKSIPSNVHTYYCAETLFWNFYYQMMIDRCFTLAYNQSCFVVCSLILFMGKELTFQVRLEFSIEQVVWFSKISNWACMLHVLKWLGRSTGGICYNESFRIWESLEWSLYSIMQATMWTIKCNFISLGKYI